MGTYDEWKSRDEPREEERMAYICSDCRVGAHSECVDEKCECEHLGTVVEDADDDEEV